MRKKKEGGKRRRRREGKPRYGTLYGNCMGSTYVWMRYGLLVWKKCMEWYGIDV